MIKISNRIGGWSLLIGFVLAVLFGFLGSVGLATLPIFIIIGLVVGFLNVSESEISRFLIFGAILVVVASFGSRLLGAISIVGNILNAMLVIFVSATIVVTIKYVFRLVKG